MVVDFPAMSSMNFAFPDCCSLISDRNEWSIADALTDADYSSNVGFSDVILTHLDGCDWAIARLADAVELVKRELRE
jgi:hypothetical protein